MVGGGQSITVECPEINPDFPMHISGLVTLHLSVVPSFDGARFSLRCKIWRLEPGSGMPPWMSDTTRGV